VLTRHEVPDQTRSRVESGPQTVTAAGYSL
jgi:hypothetical protein